MSEIEATWEICCDGYYPYCKNCGYEPDYFKLSKNNFKLPDICPNCGAKMINTDELN